MKYDKEVTYLYNGTVKKYADEVYINKLSSSKLE